MSNNKTNINAQIQTAIRLLQEGDKDGAQESFDQITDLPIENADTLEQLGVLASQLGEHVAAINIYTQLVEDHPDNASYFDGLGQAYLNNENLLQARSEFTKAIKINSELLNSHMQLGYIAIQCQEFSVAIAPLEKALSLKPSNQTVHINLIIALTQINELDQAQKYGQKLIRLHPKLAEVYYLLGVIQKLRGQFDEAIAYYEKAIRLNKTLGNAYSDLAVCKKFSDADSLFIKQAEKILLSGMPVKERASIHFSLGKIYSDCKEWEKSFEHYKQANLIGKPPLQNKLSYEIFDKSHKHYTKKLFQRTEGLGSDSAVPVFIVGMPRSGTSLIEQIISSHPEGAGAGELFEIDNIYADMCSMDNLNSYGQELEKSLNIEAMQRYAQTYLDVLCHGREDAGRVVDKMPDNYLYIGLIHILFPKAHIIHATRSPIDTCLSCFFTPFRDVTWSFDQNWIAERYALYRKAMDYWQTVLPEGRLIEVSYEDLVADQERQTKRIIESIGLTWNSACLEFYKDKRIVNTASVWQVRQPIYATSSKRWHKYSHYIEPLVNSLSKFLEKDDLEELERQGIKLKKKWYSKIFG